MGGGTLQPEARYTPLLKRERGGSIEEANRRWREGAKGKRNLEKMARRAEERGAGRAAEVETGVGSASDAEMKAEAPVNP